MADRTPRVLDVGQCDLDHGSIQRLLADEFRAVLDRAGGADEAFDAVKRHDYHLVLVNRVFDADGSSGLDFIRRLQGNDETRRTPVMLVSNYSDAQDEAVKSGARHGFGKSALQSADTVNVLARYLRG